MIAPQQTSVLIVGGGPVGLTMALLLDRFGIDCVLAERNPTTTTHPKARGTMARSMELFRVLGVDEAMRSRGLRDDADRFVVVDEVAGHEFGRNRSEPNLDQTPSWKSIAAQDVVEEELFNKLQDAKHVRLLFDTEVTGFEETEAGVRAGLRSAVTGEGAEVSASYLIGADGAGSFTRRAAGIEMIGPQTLAVMSNEYWMGDLSQFPAAADTAGFFVVPKDESMPRATILNSNGRDRWLTSMRIGTTADERERPWTDEEFADMTRKHVGLPGLDVKVISRSIWRVSMQIAETFQKGRVFLVGDAAHRFPPTGGFGMNTGLQDAQNLAWKLAFVLNGFASERLLESYTAERRHVAQSNANFSRNNYRRFDELEKAVRSGNRDRIEFWIEDLDNHTQSIGQSLGQVYEEGAVIQDGTPPPVLDPRRYRPTDRPGARFPHFWLDNDKTRSTIDWFDKTLVLVARAEAEGWHRAGAEVAAASGVPLETRVLPRGDREDGIHIGLHGAVLVRPDGHVAWRRPWTPERPGADLSDALTTLFG